MNICIYGVGGVGGYFGTLITQSLSKENKIYYIARGKHKEAIGKNGLTLKKSGGEEIVHVSPTLCTDNIDEIPNCDIIIVSVKSYDLDAVSQSISKITHDKTIILPLLNGVDIYQRIRKHLSKGIVLPSCVYVGTHIESPGVIFQKGGSCKILFGFDPKNPDANIEPLKDVFDNTSINYDYLEDIQIAIWSKYMFIAAYGLVTATFNNTVGEVLADEQLRSKTQSIMEEIKSIADKLNISLPRNIVESSLHKASDFPFEAKTSFQRDVETKGKLNEGDLFGGTIVNLGKKLSIPVSNTHQVYSELLQIL